MYIINMKETNKARSTPPRLTFINNRVITFING